jgi:hypothetical protein
MSKQSPVSSTVDERPKNMFSRRHETREAHDAAYDQWERRWTSNFANADLRAKERAQRTPAQQLALLDERLGAGVGATKERARLTALMQQPAVKAA